MRVLLATDGSAYARAAPHLLLRLLQSRGCRITLLTVLDTGVLPLGADATGVLVPVWETLRQKAEQLLASQAQELRSGFDQVEPIIREGNPADQIVQAAQELGSDLVVTGSRGEGRWERYLLGSVSLRVLQHAPCSVLLVRPPADGPEAGPLRMLFASDGSPASTAAAGWLKSSGLLAGNELLLVRAMTFVRAFRMDIVQTSSPAWMEGTTVARDHLAQLQESFQETAARVTTQLREGEDAAAELIDAAQKYRADIMVVGCRGAGAVSRFLLGSVSSKVAHHAGCSVMVIR